MFPTNWIRRDGGKFDVDGERILLNIQELSDVPVRDRPTPGFICESLSREIHDITYRMVEPEVSLYEIGASNGCGCYFQGTDRFWIDEPENWPYLTRCLYLTSRVFFDVSVLTHHAESPVIYQVFDYLKYGQHFRKAHSPPLEVIPEITVDLRVTENHDSEIAVYMYI